MRLGALKIAIIYVVAGVLWITLSDELLSLLQKYLSLRAVLVIGSVKGIVYVLLTGLLLYKLIKIHTNRLADSELRYRSYFDDNPNPMFIIDFRTMAFIAVNEACLVYYGYSRDEFSRMSLFDICPPADLNIIYSAVRELAPGMNDNGVWRHVKKDTSVVDVYITSHLLRNDKSGNIMAMVKEMTA